MSTNALAFYLDSPMQSWGSSSRFQRRETESFPTKSGVIGLIAASMGIDKHASDEKLQLKPLSVLQFTVFRLDKDSGSMLRLSDFHTVGGGYDRHDPKEKKHVCRTADGKVCANAVITRRSYLTDTRFIAVLEGDAPVLASCATALENPVWGIWFGRKCCIPATPLSPTLAPTVPEAVQALAKLLGFAKINPQSLEGQNQTDDDGSWFQADHPISFGTREFQSRPVSRIIPDDKPKA